MKLQLFNFFLLWLGSFSICTELYSQTLSFQSYSSAQGLSQNSVFSIAETDDGFMWFGTQDGLNRFDGKDFVHIEVNKAEIKTTNEGATGFSKMITALCADSNCLWVGTTYELVVYDRFANRFLKPRVLAKGFEMPENIWVLKIERDSDGNIWVLTRNKGLFCYSRSMQKMIPISFEKGNPNILSLSFDSNGVLWASSETELFKRGKEGVFEAMGIAKIFTQSGFGIEAMQVIKGRPWLITNTGEILLLSFSKNKTIISIPFNKEFFGKKYLTDARLLHQSDSNTVWIGSRSDGLIKVNLQTNTFDNTMPYQTDHGLRHPFILSFFTNKQQIVWTGTSGGGVSKYDADRPQFDLWNSGFFKNGSKAGDNMILSVFTDNDSDFYMGTMVDGLVHFNPGKGTWNYHLPGELHRSPASKNIYTIAEGENNTLWLATWGGLYHFDRRRNTFKLFSNPKDEQTKELTVVGKLKQEHKLLAGGYRGGFRLFNLESKQFEMPKDPGHVLDSLKLRVRYMKEMQHGDIYMGTEAKGFIKYNYLTGLFTFFPQFSKISNDCRHFCFSNGNVWIATTEGLIQADFATMTVKKIWSIKDGITNNYIYAVETDDNGKVWVSSNAGICSINTVTGICQIYKEENGLQGKEYNTAAACKTGGNSIWFGGINGLNRIKILQSKQFSVAPPSPLLTSIKVMNVNYVSDTAIPYLHTILLPHNKNFISFEFQAPVFSQTENVIYEYKLTNVDTGWVNIGSRNFANYTQLKPGRYNFLIRCANANMVWSKPITAITINIVPPWYGSWWFRLLCLLIAALILTYAIRQRIKSIQYKARYQQRIAETEMAALKAQLNPHFMFNCISSIDGLIQNNEKYNATNYLNKFAKLMRNVLEGSRENTIAFSKDIETLKLYLDLEQLRNENKYCTQLIVSEKLMNSAYVVPPLIIQPFVENAILHGLKNRSGNSGILNIQISQTDDHLIYIISDNGVGRLATEKMGIQQHKSYGVQMSMDRVKLFNAEEFPSVKIEDQTDNGIATGTIVTVKLKLK